MKTLEELFYDPKSGFVNSEKLYQRAKEYGYSIKDVREYYKKQELNQLNKQKVGSIAYFPIGGRGEGSYQADLMFIDEVVVLCVINVNTRMAYCYLIGKKSGAIDGLKKFVAEVKGVRFIQTDQGTEFVNGQVRKLFEEKGIEWDTVRVGDHNGQAKVFFFICKLHPS